MEVEGQLPFVLQVSLEAISRGDHGFLVFLAVVCGRRVAGEQLQERRWALILVWSPSSVQRLLEGQ